MNFFDENMEEDNLENVLGLIERYENAERENKSLYLEVEDFEQIITFYQENREFKRAMSVVENALDLFPNSAELWIKKAEVFAEQNKFDDALSALEKAEGYDESLADVFLLRADILLAKGQHQLALDITDHAFELANESYEKCDIHLLRADIYEDLELYSEVIEELFKAIEVDSNNEEAFTRAWFCVELTGHYYDSMVFHKKVVDEYPYCHLAWFNLGHAYTGMEKYDDALEAFGYVTAIDETYDLAYMLSGDIYMAREQYDTALNSYYDALKSNKHNKEIFYKIAECHEKKGELLKCRNFLRKALNIDPQFEEAHFKIGETYRAEDNFPKAIYAFERALKISPEEPDNLTALADCYIMNDEPEKGIPLLEKALDLDGSLKHHYVNLATAFFGIEKHKESLDLLRVAFVKFPQDADLYYLAFIFYYQIGNMNQAFLHLEKGLMLNFDEHKLIFEIEPNLIENDTVQNIIDQYRPNL